MHARTTHPIASSRRGFTLLEVLIVIAIIAIVASMVLVVYARSGENARIAGTKVLIKQIDSSLQERLESFRRYDFGPIAQAKFRYDNYATQALAVKLMYREAFPQRVEDLYGFDGESGDGHHIDGSTPMPNNQKRGDNSGLWFILQKKVNRPSSEMADPTSDYFVSSAELLYLTMTESNTYGLPPLDLDGINPQYVADLDEDGLPEFVDGWGQPLRFYSAPTALLRPDGNVYDTDLMGSTGTPITLANHARARILMRSVPPLPLDSGGNPRQLDWDEFNHPLNIDPHDLLGEVLLDGDDDTDRETFAEITLQSQSTFFTPLIVSAGPDQRLGMFEPSDRGGTNETNRLGKIDTSNLDGMFDNLTNHQRGGL